jgi:cyclopropane-fatty-acyl-phospholipid synthase
LLTSRFTTGFYRQLVIRQLQALRGGQITLVENGKTVTVGNTDRPDALTGVIEIHDPGCYEHIVLRGSVGAAEAFMAGHWSTDSLLDLVRIMVRNLDVLDRMEQGFARLAGISLRWIHRLRRNSRGGSKKNIAAHYDLGNDFFALFLDHNMMYSSAVFEHPQMTLEQAATAKLDRICRKLQLRPHHHVLEIGTGWGGFALHAARHYGCRVTTTTISAQQYQLACERVAAAGLSDRIVVLQQDYRDLQGHFDKLVSIEMIEAVGHEHLEQFMQCCCTLLKPDGQMLIQAITIEDRRYQRAVSEIDFIKYYIFPGGCLPSVSRLTQAMAKASDFRLVQLEDIGLHYARTLHLWYECFYARLDEVRRLGYSEQLIRMWDYYLNYCEGGFLEGSVSAVQMLFNRPAGCCPALLPLAEPA